MDMQWIRNQMCTFLFDNRATIQQLLAKMLYVHPIFFHEHY